jgi:cytochrome b561/polyisoprenoid-binding protein YceI
MPLANTADSYGAVARLFHWLTALLILTAIPLGLIANGLPYESSEQLAQKAQLFSLHKTVGVAAFLVAALRILWALLQPHPRPLHPDRRWETGAAALVHWSLYISMLVVPLTGWIHHAATTGFAPILWPFGQTLPFVPTSEPVAQAAAALHWVFTKILVASILLHVAGALKHVLIDRDATLARMVSGRAASGSGPGPGWLGPALAALAIYGAGAALAVSLIPPTEAPGTATQAPALSASASNWTVQEGQLGLTVVQLGQKVSGSFADWAADIRFDEAAVDGANGSVTVTIDVASVTLGSVSAQAKGADFFDTAAHPTATFTATIRPGAAAGDYTAEGTLTLKGRTVPVTLPFTLALDGATARMQGTTTLDRRDFGIGAGFPDEKNVGFPVIVTVDLTATRD